MPLGAWFVRRGALWGLVAGTVLALAAMQPMNIAMTTPASPFGVLSVQFAATDDRLAEIWAAWDEQTRVAAILQLRIDFVFVVFYTLLLIALVLRTGDRTEQLTVAAKLMILGALLAGTADVVENLETLKLFRSGLTDGSVTRLYVAAIVKFALLASVCLSLFWSYRQRPSHRPK